MAKVLSFAANSSNFFGLLLTRSCHASRRSISCFSCENRLPLVSGTSTLTPKKYPAVVLTTSATVPWLQTTRCNTSFLNKTSADQLWKGVTSVSNAGKKSGRGKGIGKKRAKNLNKGQIIGVGSENMLWPGLNAPVLKGRDLVQQAKLPNDEEREANLRRLRDTMGVFRPILVDPLDRGWSGTKLHGRRIGPPDPIGEDSFEGFETIVLESKTVTHMTAVFGRKRSSSIFVVTGNGNGLGGFALAKGSVHYKTLNQAKNRAGQKLLYIERYNGHTVMHDFFTHFGDTKIFVSKKPEGYGLRCHRAIKAICEIVGIKDIYCIVEGSTKNIQNLTKAFFLGLLRQKTHQEMADEKQLHLVEFREENLNFPKVVASPQANEVRTLAEIPKDEELDFQLFLMDGKLQSKKKKHIPFYTKQYGWEIYKKKYAHYRNAAEVRKQLILEYGQVRSFYADQYPECVGVEHLPRKEREVEE